MGMLNDLINTGPSRFFTDPLTVLILMLVFGVTGIVLLLYAYAVLEEDKEISAWPSVSGVIVSAHVQKVNDTRRSGHHLVDVVRYAPKIKYAYTVDGVAYEGHFIGNGNYESRDPDSAKKLAGKYPAHTEVLVHYDPQKPEKAVLENDKKKEIPLFMAAWFLTLLGFLCGVVWLHSVWVWFLGLFGAH